MPLPDIDKDPLRTAAKKLVGLSTSEPLRIANGSPSLPLITDLVKPPEAAPTPAMPSGDRSIGREFWDSLLYSVGPQNIQMLGAGIQSKGQRFQSKQLHDLGVRIKTWGRQLDLGEPASMPPVEDIETLVRWSAGALGQGLGSITIPITGGAAGAGLGATLGPKGALVGGVAGAFAANESVLEGEAFEQFRMEGVDQPTASKAAGTIAPILASFDTLGLFKVLQGPLRRPKQMLLSYVGKRIAHGAAVEGVTEMLQGAVREYTAADLTGKRQVMERLTSILEEGAAAALTGGVVGGAAGVAQRNRRRPDRQPASAIPDIPRETDVQTDLPPEAPEAPAAAPEPEPTPEPEPQPGPAAATPPEDLPTITDAQMGEVARLIREGMDPAAAVAQVQAQETADAGQAPEATETPEAEPAPAAPAPVEETPPAAEAPTAEEVTAAAEEAATSPTNDLPEPTDAQKEAGNYKKGHIKIHGLDISIENPRGSERSGKDSDGETWSVKMPADYGYVRRTEGADGDHVDVYIGPDPVSERVFVVDQVDAETGAWDEHKVMLGYYNMQAAKAAYDKGFSDGKGPQRRARVTPVAMGEFKEWLAKGDTKRPYAPDLVAKAAEKPETEPPEEAPKVEEKPAPAPESSTPPDTKVGAPFEGFDLKLKARLPKMRSRRMGYKAGELMVGKDEAGNDWYTDGQVAIRGKIPSGHVEKETLPEGWTRIISEDWETAPVLRPVAVRDLLKNPAQGVNSDYLVRFNDGSAIQSNHYRRLVRLFGDGIEFRHGTRETGRQDPALVVVKDGEVVGVVSVMDSPPTQVEQGMMDKRDDMKPSAPKKPKPKPKKPAAKPKPKPKPKKPAPEKKAEPEPAPVDETPPASETVAEPAEEPDRPKGYGESNTIFTADAAEEARKRLIAKFNQAGAGIDPETLQDGILLAGYHIEAGARSFADFSKIMLRDLGEWAKPFLRSWYEGVRYYPGFDNAGMTSAADIDAMEAEATETETDDAAEPPGDEVDTGDDDGGPGPGPAEDVAADEGTGADAGGTGEPGAGGPAVEPGTEPVSAPEPGESGTGEGTGPGTTAGLPAEEGIDGGPDRGPGLESVERNNIRLANEESPLKEDRSPLQKARDNMAALELLHRIENDNRAATPREQGILALYAGWGGIKGAFPDAEGKFAKGYEEIGTRLQEMLSQREYDQAERSIQYAHYTSEAVIRTMWRVAERMGFTGGRILEPGAGIGHFAGFMPDAIADNAATNYVGIEMDSTSARIAKLLYPKYDIHHADFAKRRVPKDHYDFAIGNPPFADIPVGNDPDYASKRFLLHDFFFAKTLDSLKPGGVMIFVTSAGTMNKLNTNAREYLADRADLVGAIRLPGGRRGAFAKSSNTEVTTDIIALRKRHEGDTPGDRTWVETENVTFKNKDGEDQAVSVNKYFRGKNRAFILGREGLFDTLIPNRYGVIMDPGENLDTALLSANVAFQSDVWNPVADKPGDLDAKELDDQSEKEHSFYVDEEDTIRQVVNGAGVIPKLTKKNKVLVRELIGIRDALRVVMQANVNRDTEAGDTARVELNRVYDDFIATHGPLNKVNRRFQRPSIVQQETARAEAREDARIQGEAWDEGSFRPDEEFYDKSASDRARIRRTARERAEAEGRDFDEGSFDPAAMPDIEIKKYPNLDPFSEDPEYFRLAALEKPNEEETEFEKGPVFRENIIGGMPTPRIKTAKDAMLSVMGQTGEFDIKTIAALYGKSPEETIAELGDDVFELPARPGHFSPSEEYLSGDVKTKLETAQQKVADNPDFQRNIDALLKVIPRDLVPSEITVLPGAKWLPPHIVAEFGKHLGLINITVTEPSGPKQKRQVQAVSTAPATAKWGVRFAEGGGQAVSPAELFSKLVNMEPSPKIYVRVGDNTFQDEKTTEAAQAQYDAMRAEFDAWWEEQAAFREEAAEIYNRQFRRTVTRKYSGEHVITPGLRTDFEWRPYQKSVIARIIQSGNTYMAHAVGAGKTSSMIGASMELRRLGLASRPMFVVPRAVLRQFAIEFQQLYPAANIAVADEKRFQGDKRRQFVASVGLDSTLDAVIMTHSSFGKIPLSNEFMTTLLEREMADLKAALQQVKDENGPRYIRQQIQKEIEKLERTFDSMKTTDQVFTFEEMGIDQLFVDEAHEFRKLGLTTSQDIKGIDTSPSARAKDLYRKVRYMRTINARRGVVFASGTPVVNTMGEAYNISRYLQEDQMNELGIKSFDAWAGTFGQTVEVFEPNAAGRYKYVRRFAKFVNLPELKNMILSVVDYIGPAELERAVVRPALKGGERQLVTAEMGWTQRAYQQVLANRIREIEKRKGPPEKGDDIILNVINDGRKMAIDMRLIDPDAKSNEPSKLDKLVNNVFDHWEETKNKAFHRPDPEKMAYEKEPFMHGPATQVVFATLGLKGPFSVVRWLRAELQRRGVPPGEIAFINDYKTHTQRLRLFNDMNDGKVRILIGHPATLGTGVNVQKRMSGMHNLDALWYPSLDEQRVGRGVRQGNMNPEIALWDYATEGSFDTQMWQMMQTKGRFIHEFWQDTDSREMDDISMDDYYEKAKAIVSGDPRLEQLGELRRKVKQLEQQKIRHEQQAHGVQASKGRLKFEIDLQADRLKRRAQFREAYESVSGDDFKATFEWPGKDQVTVEKRKEADELFAEARAYARSVAAEGFDGKVFIGKMGGMEMHIFPLTDRLFMTAPDGPEDGTAKFDLQEGKSPRASLEHWLRTIPEQYESQKEYVERLRQQMADLEAQPEIGPFPKRQELREMQQEARDLQDAMAREAAEQERAENQEPTHQRRSDVPEKPLTLARASQVVGQIVRRWDPMTAPTVRVLNAWDDLPQRILDSVQAPATGKTIAGIQQGDVIYVFADAHSTVDALRRTLMHEAVGHYSMQQMLGDQFPSLLAEVYKSRDRAGFREAFSEVLRKYPDASPDTLAEEMIAHMAEKGVKAPIMNRIYAAIRRFLRSLGFRIAISHDEIRAMLQRASRRMMSDLDRENATIAALEPEPDLEGNPRQAKVNDALHAWSNKIQYMIAWHGSPHQFDRFSTLHVDSGEGTQNEGWGLYFTSKKSVAEWYRDQLKKEFDSSNVTFRFKDSDTGLDYYALGKKMLGQSEADAGRNFAVDTHMLVDDALGTHADLSTGLVETVREYVDWRAKEPRPDPKLQDAFKRFADLLESGDLILVNPQQGSVSEVELAPDDDQMLHFDKPVDEQPKAVQEALTRLDVGSRDRAYWHTGFSHILSSRNPFLGRDAYYALTEKLGGQKRASLALLAEGVRGNKYKSGSGNHFNYVIFDDSDITVKDQVRYKIVDQRGEKAPDPEQVGRAPYIELTRPIESVFRLMTLPFGGIDAKGNLRVSEPVLKRARKVIREWRPDPNGRFRWMDKWIQAGRFNWLNRHGTPKEFIARERKKFTHAYEIMQELVGFLEAMKSEGVGIEESRALQEILEGKELNDDRLSRLAKPIRDSLDAYGLQLVELGLLPEQAYLRNLGKYLHRSYRRYEFDTTPLARFARGREKKRRRALRGDELMRRGRVHNIDMKRLLKDVPPRYRRTAAKMGQWEIIDRISEGGRVSKRVYKPIGFTHELLTNTAGKGWISQGIWEMRRETGTAKPFLWRDWTEAEREEMGEIRDARYNLIRTYELLANDLATGRFFEDIAQNPDWFQPDLPRDASSADAHEVTRRGGFYADVEWVRVPDAKIPKSNAKRWGAIAGGYVRASIWRDLNELEKMQNPGWWGAMLREWKANKTARSPGVHFNNVMGNLVLSELYDFTPAHLKHGLIEFIKRGPVYEEARAMGIFEGGYVRTELNRQDLDTVIEDVIREVEAKEGVPRTNMQRTFDLFRRLDRKMRDAYRWEDEVFRLISYMHDRARGATKEEAAVNAVDRFLNYDIRAPFPNALRRTVLPFFSYTYAFVPQWAKAVTQKPWKVAKIATVGYALQAFAYWMTEGDEDEERRVMSDRDTGFTWAGLPKMVRTPFTSGDDPIYISTTRILPGGGLADTDKSAIGLPEWMMVSGPITTAFEVMFNRATFLDVPITEDIDTPLEKAEKNFAYLWRAFMPNAFWIPRSWDQNRIIQAASDETDMFGREYSIPVAALRSFGPKLYPMDTESQLTYRLFEIEREMQDWRQRLREATTDRMRNRISQSTYNRRVKRVTEGLNRLRKRSERIMGRAA